MICVFYESLVVKQVFYTDTGEITFYYNIPLNLGK